MGKKIVILFEKPIKANIFRHLDFSTIMFANETFSATEGTIISATTTSTLVRDILEMAEKETEESFVEEVEKIIREDEVSAGKFRNINTNKHKTGQRCFYHLKLN